MSATPLSVEPAALFSCQHSVAVNRWSNGNTRQIMDCVADEVPVAMVYNGISHAVMLATPASLEQFGLGFSLTEGIIRNNGELREIEVIEVSNGIELRMTIPPERFLELKQKRRSMAGRTGCGLCGAESLQHVIRHPSPVAGGASIAPQILHTAFCDLAGKQPLQAATGAAHAAAWATTEGHIVQLEEDIGRHNALDKLIGTLAHASTDPGTGFAIVTSRASYEMVQKAASFGIGILAAISAPTSLAIRLAEETGLTLIGFTRNNSHVVYANSQRFIQESP